MVQEDLAATRTQWVRVAPRVPSQTWLAASRTGWVRVAPMCWKVLAATRTGWVRVVLVCFWLGVSVRVAPDGCGSHPRQSEQKVCWTWPLSGAGRTQHRQRQFWTVFWSLFKGSSFCSSRHVKTLVICLLKVPPPLLHSHVLRSLVHLFNSLESW